MLPYVRKSPSAADQKVFELNIFGGGMNNVSGDTKIEDNESTNTQNMMFISLEQMETRPGNVLVDEIALTHATTWIDEFKPINLPAQIVRADDQQVIFGTETEGYVQGNIEGLTYAGKYYFVDGNTIQMYDGTNTYTVLEDPKSYATVAVSNGTVAPWIAVEHIDERVTVGQKIQHETATAIHQLTVTQIDLATNTVKVSETLTEAIEIDDMIRFYTPRPKATYFDGQIKYDNVHYWVWYEPCDYELEDSLKGENYIPSNATSIMLKGERVYFAGDENNPHNVYICDIANPLYCPAMVGFQTPANGDVIVDIAEFDNALLIARHRDWFVIYGNSPDPTSADMFHMERIDAHIGLMAKHSYAILNNMLFFLGYDGKFYKMNTPQTNVEYLLTRPLPYKINLYREPFGLTEADMNDITTIVYDNHFFMTIGGLVIVYSYNNQGFTFFKGWDATSLYTDGKTVYIGNGSGQLTKWDKTIYSDLGQPIESIYETKRFNMGKTANFKYFNQCMLTTHAFPEKVTDIELSFEVDFFALKAKKTIRSAMSLFGYASWGDKFSDSEIMTSYWNMINAKGRTLKLKFYNNAIDQPVRIYEATVVWSIRDIR